MSTPGDSGPQLAGAAGSARSEWLRGYYCAVAAYLRENCSPGVCDTEGASLFRSGGDWRLAYPEDIETFREHGLVPPNSELNNSSRTNTEEQPN